eukprot:Em0059g24a
MVDLETAARWFKDALDAPGAVESATQLRTLLASIKADLQRLLRRIHPPGPPTVPRAPRVVVAHAVLSSAMPTCEPSKSAVVVPHWNRNCGTISLPIESAVAGASCTATIANCESDVLASVSWMDSYTVFSNIHRLNFSARNFGRS